jgi:hypothetical protein
MASKDFPDVQKIRRSYIAKAIIATTLIVLALAFAVGVYTNADVGGQLRQPESRDSHKLIRLPPI